jgi:hypothetical protein
MAERKSPFNKPDYRVIDFDQQKGKKNLEEAEIIKQEKLKNLFDHYEQYAMTSFSIGSESITVKEVPELRARRCGQLMDTEAPVIIHHEPTNTYFQLPKTNKEKSFNNWLSSVSPIPKPTEKQILAEETIETDTNPSTETILNQITTVQNFDVNTQLQSKEGVKLAEIVNEHIKSLNNFISIVKNFPKTFQLSPLQAVLTYAQNIRKLHDNPPIFEPEYYVGFEPPQILDTDGVTSELEASRNDCLTSIYTVSIQTNQKQEQSINPDIIEDYTELIAQVESLLELNRKDSFVADELPLRQEFSRYPELMEIITSHIELIKNKLVEINNLPSHLQETPLLIAKSYARQIMIMHRDPILVGIPGKSGVTAERPNKERINHSFTILKNNLLLSVQLAS